MEAVSQNVALKANPRTSSVAKRAFFNIMDKWSVSDANALVLLGQPRSRAIFYEWKKGKGGKLPPDTVERISYVIGIYKALQILFPEPTQADAWIRRPNAQFGGKSALDRMLAGNVADLHSVRSYLDYVRGGLF